MSYHDIFRFCGNTYIVNKSNLSSLYSYADTKKDGIFVSLIGKRNLFEYFKSRYVIGDHNDNSILNSRKSVYCYLAQVESIKNTDIYYFDFTALKSNLELQWDHIYSVCFNISDIVIFSMLGSSSSKHIEDQMLRILSHCHQNTSMILILYGMPSLQCHWDPTTATTALLSSFSLNTRRLIRSRFSSFMCVHIPYIYSYSTSSPNTIQLDHSHVPPSFKTVSEDSPSLSDSNFPILQSPENPSSQSNQKQSSPILQSPENPSPQSSPSIPSKSPVSLQWETQLYYESCLEPSLSTIEPTKYGSERSRSKSFSSNNQGIRSTAPKDDAVETIYKTENEPDYNEYLHNKSITDIYVDGTYLNHINTSISTSGTLNVTIHGPVETDPLQQSILNPLSASSPHFIKSNRFTKIENRYSIDSDLFNDEKDKVQRDLFNEVDTSEDTSNETLEQFTQSSNESFQIQSNSTPNTSKFVSFFTFSPVEDENDPPLESEKSGSPPLEDPESSIPTSISRSPSLSTKSLSSVSPPLFSPIYPLSKRFKSKEYEKQSKYQIKQFSYVYELLLVTIPQIIQNRNLHLSPKLLFCLFKKRLSSIFKKTFDNYQTLILNFWSSIFPSSTVIEHDLSSYWDYLAPPFYYSYSATLFNEDYMLRHQESVQIFVLLCQQYLLGIFRIAPLEMRIKSIWTFYAQIFWRIMIRVLNNVLPCIEAYQGDSLPSDHKQEIVLCLQQRKNHQFHSSSRPLDTYSFWNGVSSEFIQWDGDYKPPYSSLPSLTSFIETIGMILKDPTPSPLKESYSFIQSFYSSRTILDIRAWSHYDHIITSSTYIPLSSQSDLTFLYPCEHPPSPQQLYSLFPYCIGCMTLIDAQILNSYSLSTDTYCYITNKDSIVTYDRPVLRHLSFGVCSDCLKSYSPFHLYSIRNILLPLHISYIFMDLVRSSLRLSICPLCHCSLHINQKTLVPSIMNSSFSKTPLPTEKKSLESNSLIQLSHLKHFHLSPTQREEMIHLKAYMDALLSHLNEQRPFL